jgi:hypothetical protein
LWAVLCFFPVICGVLRVWLAFVADCGQLWAISGIYARLFGNYAGFFG